MLIVPCLMPPYLFKINRRIQARFIIDLRFDLTTVLLPHSLKEIAE